MRDSLSPGLEQITPPHILSFPAQNNGAGSHFFTSLSHFPSTCAT